ncbi:hypothetical protein QQX98_009710 [Neonectria punicea]|uniref:Uncharacterized protein n=1 Tax=Neonectria punicea TaxID=979145 RepID=A0ABR1GRU3_9HYPO
MADRADNLGSLTSRGHSSKRNWAKRGGPDFHQPGLSGHDSHGRHEFTNATTTAHSPPSMSKAPPPPNLNPATRHWRSWREGLSRPAVDGSEATHAKVPSARPASALSTKQTDVAPKRPRVKATHLTPDESTTDKSTKVDGQAKTSLLAALWWLVKLPFSFVFGLLKGTLKVSRKIVNPYGIMMLLLILASIAVAALALRTRSFHPAISSYTSLASSTFTFSSNLMGGSRTEHPGVTEFALPVHGRILRKLKSQGSVLLRASELCLSMERLNG